MKMLVGVISLCFAVVTHAASRIVGGNDAPEGAYKYQVSLRYEEDDVHFCGGSIMNNRWILTAAHCVEDEESDSVRVVAGTTQLKGGKEQVYQSEYIVMHEDYNSDNPTVNDIALIRVSRDIEFNEKVQPIALHRNEVFENGYLVKLTGWGSTNEIDLKLYDQEDCKKDMKDVREIISSHICTLTKIGQGACYGDSGGPLVADGVQVGIVSFGKPCARGKPDVFTRVQYFFDWIAAVQAKF